MLHSIVWMLLFANWFSTIGHLCCYVLLIYKCDSFSINPDKYSHFFLEQISTRSSTGRNFKNFDIKIQFAFHI